MDNRHHGRKSRRGDEDGSKSRSGSGDSVQGDVDEIIATGGRPGRGRGRGLVSRDSAQVQIDRIMAGEIAEEETNSTRRSDGVAEVEAVLDVIIGGERGSTSNLIESGSDEIRPQRRGGSGGRNPAEGESDQMIPGTRARSALNPGQRELRQIVAQQRRLGRTAQPRNPVQAEFEEILTQQGGAIARASSMGSAHGESEIRPQQSGSRRNGSSNNPVQAELDQVMAQETSRMAREHRDKRIKKRRKARKEEASKRVEAERRAEEMRSEAEKEKVELPQ